MARYCQQCKSDDRIANEDGKMKSRNIVEKNKFERELFIDWKNDYCVEFIFDVALVMNSI